MADAYLTDALRSNCGSWLACDDALTADAVIPCTYPFLRSRPLRVPLNSGALWKRAGMPAQPKVTKGLLPHHSAPRLGSVCPNAGLNPWAAATRHPWRGAANPASCRVTHEFKPAFGQRGLTGRLRSRSKADQERLASHRGYRPLLQPTKLCR